MPDLRATTHQLHRALRRRRRLIAALLAGFAVFAFARVLAPPPPDTTAVVVASRDLAAGSVIGPDDIRVVHMTSNLVPTGIASTSTSLVDETLASPVREGEPISDRRLVSNALMAGYSRGLVATPVRVDDAEVVALLRVGDHIDVYAARAASTLDAPMARLVVSNAVVVTLPAADSSSIDGNRDGALVVLGVTPTAAASLAQASADGQVSLSLRG